MVAACPRAIQWLHGDQRDAYDEIVELFARGSSPAEILRFHPSPAAQQRASELLARSKAGAITEDEAAELERQGQLEHLVQRVKARARWYAQAQPEAEMTS